MNHSKVYISLIRSLPITAGTFILSIVLMSVGSLIDGNMISPVNILMVFGMFIVIGVINFFRVYIDGTRWARSKPSVIKNFIFAPVYFVIAMAYIVWLYGGMYLNILFAIGTVFLAVFLIMQLISYFAAKKVTDRMNDALKIFLKEHEGDEQE